jgi:HEAT repeat protein
MFRGSCHDTESFPKVPPPIAACSILAVAITAVPVPVSAQDWVGPLTDILPTPSRPGSSPQERIREIRRLGRHGPAAAAVASLLTALQAAPPPDVREEILQSLARRGHPDSVRVVRRMIAETDQPIVPLFRVLTAVGNRPAIEPLIEALRDDRRAAAAEAALGRIGRGAVEPLIEALAANRNRRVIRVLGSLRDSRAVPALTRALRSGTVSERVAAIYALGSITDRRSAAAIAAAARGGSPAVVEASLRALSETGRVEGVPVALEFIEHDVPSVRLAALGALTLLDPTRAEPVLRRLLHALDPATRQAAEDLLVRNPRPVFASLLRRLLTEGRRGEEAAGALARVPRGAGMRALIDTTADHPEKIAETASAIAVGLRRWRSRLGDDLRRRGQGIIRAVADDERRMLLRALARDQEVSATLAAGIRQSSARTRAASAYGIELLGKATLGAALLRAMGDETDPEAFRRQASAAVRLGIYAPHRILKGHFSNPGTAPEAFVLAAKSSGTASERNRRDLAISLRRALRSRTEVPARTRAAAALSLAYLRDRNAGTALVVSLSDPSAQVRLAAVTAIGSLGGARSAAALESHARVEMQSAVRSNALRVAASLRAGRSPTVGDSRNEILVVHVVDATGEGGGRPPVEVLFDDGRWARFRPLSGGELMLVDLDSALVELRIQPSPPSDR